MTHYTNILVHRSSHKSVHDVLAVIGFAASLAEELPAIVAVDCVSQTDNHFKVVHVYVPVWAIGKQTE